MLSLTDLLARIDDGALTPQDAIALQQEAIAAREPEIAAFAHRDEAAAAHPAGSGPLAGIGVGVKDIIDTVDMPTACGSPIYEGWHPQADAPIVAALKRAGATILGKTTTTPFAFSDPTATRNPVNLAHTPGGSSAGSAAAVGAGMIPLAIGTQTGGSVIRPASYCGVAALKPSFRTIPTVGVKCFSWSLDTVGLFAASVKDVAVAFAAITGRQTIGPAHPGRPRFGLVTQDFAGVAEPASRDALAHAAAALERAGAELRPVALPTILAEAWEAHATIQGFEAWRALAFEYDRHRAALSPALGATLEAASAIPVEAYDEARRTAHRARGALAELYRDVDVILTYSAPGAAPSGYASTGSHLYNRLWTLMGNPCVNVPGYRDAAGMPVGVQVIAPFGRDATALSLAGFAENAIKPAT